MLYRDPQGHEFVLALVGAGIGGTWGLVNGLIAGDTGWELAADLGAGVATGGLAGLTNGLPLLDGIAARSVLSAGIEAYRQLARDAVTGCARSGISDIVFAGAGSVIGDGIGSFSAAAASEQVGNALHMYVEPSEFTATVVSGILGGSVAAPVSAIEGAERRHQF